MISVQIQTVRRQPNDAGPQTWQEAGIEIYPDDAKPKSPRNALYMPDKRDAARRIRVLWAAHNSLGK